MTEDTNNDYYLYQRVITMIIIYTRGRRTLVLITKKYTGNNKHVSAETLTNGRRLKVHQQRHLMIDDRKKS